MGPLLDDKHRAAVRSDQGQLRRHRQQRHAGLRDAQGVARSPVRGHAEGASRSSAAAAPNDSTYEYGYMHKHTSGALWDVVAGYRGTPEMALAMERGEIDGLCGWDWSSFKSQKPEWLRDNKANVLLQVSLEPHPELTKMGVPTRVRFRQERGRPQGGRADHQPDRVPPLLHRAAGHAAGQLEVLRAAFDKTMADQVFLADAEKLRIDIEPLSGARRCRTWCQALRNAAGDRRARPQGDPAGLRDRPMLLVQPEEAAKRPSRSIGCGLGAHPARRRLPRMRTSI